MGKQHFIRFRYTIFSKLLSYIIGNFSLFMPRCCLDKHFFLLFFSFFVNAAIHMLTFFLFRPVICLLTLFQVATFSVVPVNPGSTLHIHYSLWNRLHMKITSWKITRRTCACTISHMWNMERIYQFNWILTQTRITT